MPHESDPRGKAEPAIVQRCTDWRGLRAVREKRFTPNKQEGGFVAPELTLLIAHAPRQDGVTAMDMVRGVSTVQDIRGKLIVAPAGCSVTGWYTPASRGQLFSIVQLHRDAPFLTDELRERLSGVAPLLHVADERLVGTAQRIASLADDPSGFDGLYAETLGTLLTLDLVTMSGRVRTQRPARGGLPGWQAARVRDYIEAHLARDLTLEELAGLVQLSTAHFCRAFAQTFGMPPHRYHLTRRIERAKDLLLQEELPVTEIALSLGFGGSSQFARAFRRVAGVTATDFRRATQ